MAASGSGTPQPVVFSPRGELALNTACRAWLEEKSQDPKSAGKMKSMNIEKSIEKTRDKLLRRGVRGAEGLAGLTSQAWNDTKLPEAMLPYVRLHAAAALGPPAPQGLELELRRPALSFGKGKGAPIRMVANHFLLRVTATPESGTWMAWQVEFPTCVEPAQPAASSIGAGGGQGRQPSKGVRGAGRAVRMQGVLKLLEKLKLSAEDWLFDGGHRLYTRKRVETSLLSGEHRVSFAVGQPLLLVVVLPAMDSECGSPKQQELDLSRLSCSRLDGRDAPDRVREELRFLQVAMRSHAVSEQGLVSKGRRVVCPQGGLVDFGEAALRHGRQLWMGYLANLEVIDDGLGIGGMRCSLSLNYSASVGLPGMPAIDLLAHLLAEEWCRGKWDRREEGFRYYKGELEHDRWPSDLSYRFLSTLNSEAGLRKLKVACDYFGHERRFTVVGVTSRPAKEEFFWYETKISVADYFKNKWGKELWCPGLPCLELNKRGNCVPIELVRVLGGEHNLMVGKLRPEYQSDVSKKTTVPPLQRRRKIESIIWNMDLGPQLALRTKGVHVEGSMLKVEGHQLQAPTLLGGGRQPLTTNNYANSVRAVAPPEYSVPWGLWSFTRDEGLERLAQSIKERAEAHGLWFENYSFIDWPSESCSVLRGSSPEPLPDALLRDLKRVSFSSSQSAVLFVLLPSDSPKDELYKFIKMHTETELCSFVTQCVIVPPTRQGTSGIQQVERKLNNIMVKLPGKLRLKQAPGRSSVSSGSAVVTEAAYNVLLEKPHKLLEASTIVIGADVTHNAAGVSVAGVVATRGSDFSTYLSELRAQSPFVLGAAKKRARKSEERIIALSDMVASLLGRWRSANEGRLPETVLYYRDGVSDGQFKPVLTMELNHLVKAFKLVGDAGYDPKLVIIVGQKRHQTRFFPEEEGAHGYGGGSSGGKGWREGGKGGNDVGNVPAGTVAGRGIAQPGHLNFFLVSAKGIKGTSIPCHYHVLHADARLEITADDVEMVTYQLCHLYSRADKVVGYAAPAYFADHLCERGKLYLEAQFPGGLDLATSQPSSEDDDERRLREQVEERVQWFNQLQARVSECGSNLQGRNFFC
uniref:Piwi domain-containing protein n=1 Tax=Pyrodinium bahamense TaxID=73915 RepID=A0A7S0ASA9_9DINO